MAAAPDAVNTNVNNVTDGELKCLLERARQTKGLKELEAFLLGLSSVKIKALIECKGFDDELSPEVTNCIEETLKIVIKKEQDAHIRTAKTQVQQKVDREKGVIEHESYNEGQAMLGGGLTGLSFAPAGIPGGIMGIMPEITHKMPFKEMAYRLAHRTPYIAVGGFLGWLVYKGYKWWCTEPTNPPKNSQIGPK